MTTLLAQADLGSLKADFIKSMVVFGIAMLVATSFVAVAIFAWLQYRLEKRSKEKEERRDRESKPREIHPQPLPVTVKPQKISGAVLKELHEELKDRVDKHDQELTELRADYTELSTDIRTQLSEMPGKIVADMLNTKKLFNND